MDWISHIVILHGGYEVHVELDHKSLQKGSEFLKAVLSSVTLHMCVLIKYKARLPGNDFV